MGNQIGFLTIQESFVEKGKTQRRPGLHVECPGLVNIAKGAGDVIQPQQRVFSWGLGSYSVQESRFRGGIYMASNVAQSCKLWNCRVIPDWNDKEIIGKNGDIEHLRSTLNGKKGNVTSVKTEANQLYWMTDRTPHESLPAEESGYRQFVRVVCHEVGIWYEDNSTPNPYGLRPNSKITRIVKGSKFDKEI